MPMGGTLSPSPSAQCHRRAWHSSSGLVFHVLYFDSNAISLYGMFDTTRNILLPKKKESRCWDDTIIVVLIVFLIFYIRLLAAEGVAYALFMHFFHWLLFLFFSPDICFLFDDVEHTRVYLIQLRASSFILSPSPSSFLLSFVIGGLALLCKRGIVLCLRSENSFSSFWASIHLFTVFVCLFSWSVFSLFLCNSLFVFFFKI